MNLPVVGPELEREIRRLMRDADIGWDEARSMAFAYLCGFGADLQTFRAVSVAL